MTFLHPLPKTKKEQFQANKGKKQKVLRKNNYLRRQRRWHSDSGKCNPHQAETLLHSLERVDAGIGSHVNAHKSEYMCFNQIGDICTLNGSSLKLVDKRLAKAWTTIDRLSGIWKSDLIIIKWSAWSSNQQSCRYCYMDSLYGR